jgi:hypothetical protein
MAYGENGLNGTMKMKIAGGSYENMAKMAKISMWRNQRNLAGVSINEENVINGNKKISLKAEKRRNGDVEEIIS